MGRFEFKNSLSSYGELIGEDYVAEYLDKLGVSKSITENPLCRYELTQFAREVLSRNQLIQENDTVIEGKQDELLEALKKMFHYNNETEILDCSSYTYDNTEHIGTTKRKEYKLEASGIRIKDNTEYDLYEEGINIEDEEKIVDENGIEMYKEIIKGKQWATKSITIVTPDPNNAGVLNVKYYPDSKNDVYVEFKDYRMGTKFYSLTVNPNSIIKIKSLIEEHKWGYIVEQEWQKDNPDLYDEEKTKQTIARKIDYNQYPGPDRSSKMKSAMERILAAQGIENDKDKDKDVA